jgi:glycerate dehydrogenase
MNIVVLDRGTLGPSVNLVRPAFEHHWVEYVQSTPEDVPSRIANADIVITNKAVVRESAMEGALRLKMIAVAATGYDVVDVEAAKRRCILVCNVRNYAVNTVPEHTFALILALRRSIAAYREDVIGGAWQRANQFCFFNHPIKDLAGSKIGIFGSGALGRSVGRIAQGFGMSVMFAARKGTTNVADGLTPFNEVLETADILTLHLPLKDDTRNLIGADEFARMRRQPLLINTARGGIVNEADLVQALDQGLIAGAGFDVLTSEPPKPDNPLLSVLTRPNVIVTPHVAWASEEAMQALWNQVILHVENFQRGQPTNVL